MVFEEKMTSDEQYLIGVFCIALFTHFIRPKSDLLTLMFALVCWQIKDWDDLPVISVIFAIGLLIDALINSEDLPEDSL